MKHTVVIITVFLTSFSNIIADNRGDIFFPTAEIINNFTTRIPFKIIDNLIVVEAELFNKRGNFIIDTGSETLILNKTHFNFKFNSQAIKETVGVNGNVEGTYKRNVQEFILHNLNFNNKSSDIIDLSHIEKSKKIRLLGIIGYNILKDFEVFIDLHLNQLTLTKVDKYGNKLDKHVYLERISDSVNFKLRNHTIVLDCFINDQKVKFGLDTAAEYNQINKRIGSKSLKYFFPNKRINLIGASNNKIEVIAGKLFKVKLSETVYFGPMNTMLTNLNNMNEAFGTKLDGVLGFEFFVQKRTIINYQKEKLYFIDYPIARQ